MTDIGTSDDLVFAVVLLAGAVLLIAGIVERRRHHRRLLAVPTRIAVNGSRGKSTVTRLATGALSAGGFKALGKTTGAEPMVVRGWDRSQDPLHRRPEGPNIGEQLTVLREASGEQLDALVFECMAITPEYQQVLHTDLLAANVVVITNVLADHLEEMGPTTADVADVFAGTIPAGGVLVAAPGEHLSTLRRAARRQGARVEIADPDAVDPALLTRFEHLVMAEHVALVLALARALGIDETIATEGMLSAPVDPLATRLLAVGDATDPAVFVNAFGANDPASTLAVWEHVTGLGHPRDGLVVVMNCRSDRVARTRQFAVDVLPHLPIDTLVVTGSVTGPVLQAAGSGQIPTRKVVDCTDRSADEVHAALEPDLSGRVVLGVGNLHGGGVEIVEEMERRAVGAQAPGGVADVRD